MNPLERFPQIRVFERGWLSSNNILFVGAGDNALVDSGYLSHAAQTLALVEHALVEHALVEHALVEHALVENSRGGATLTRLLNTHCHSDHMGGNAAIQERYGCRTSIPVGEAPLIEAWDEEALLLTYADQRAERFRIDDTLAPGDTLRLGNLDWQVLAAPGHDPHALMFYAPEAKILISGDALWENGFGVIFPQMFGRATAFAETRGTLETIAGLDVEIVIPGHGPVFTEVDAALERAFSRLAAYEEDPGRLARHAAKVMLTFALLEKRSLAVADLPAYLERVPIMRDINNRYLAMTPEHLAEWLVHELERARAIQRVGGAIVPVVAA